MKPFPRTRYPLCLLAWFVALLPILIMSCAKRVDTSDPEAVAKAFIVAVANNDVEEALQYVIPEELAYFRKDMEKGLPPFPKEFDIKVTVNRDQANVEILNTKGFEFDMKRMDEKWWIVK